jgi:hypothetical protein
MVFKLKMLLGNNDRAKVEGYVFEFGKKIIIPFSCNRFIMNCIIAEPVSAIQ